MNTGFDISFPHLGIQIENLEKGITIGGFTIAFYGIIIAIGMVAGILLARCQAKRTGQDPELYSDFAIYAIIFSVIGARLYYVIFSFDQYKDNLLQIFNTRGGGMAIYGAVIAAVLTAIVYCRKKKYSFFLLADTACAGLVLGQIIGRWGNFMNREAFGGYTDNLFAMRLKEAEVASGNITDSIREHIIVENGISYIQVHPTFLYESLWNIMVLVLILIFIKKKRFDGEMFLLYLVGYGMGRLWIEGLRTDQLLIPGTNVAVSQILSGVLVVGGIIYWIYRRKTMSVVGSQAKEDSE